MKEKIEQIKKAEQTLRNLLVGEVYGSYYEFFILINSKFDFIKVTINGADQQTFKFCTCTGNTDAFFLNTNNFLAEDNKKRLALEIEIARMLIGRRLNSET